MVNKMEILEEKAMENEVFAIRDGEWSSLYEQRPTEGRWFAIQARTVSFPEGPTHPVRQSDQALVENAAIIACQIVDGKWQWMQLSPPTKADIGDLLFDCNAEKDKWYYLVITQDEPPQGEVL